MTHIGWYRYSLLISFCFFEHSILYFTKERGGGGAVVLSFWNPTPWTEQTPSVPSGWRVNKVKRCMANSKHCIFKKFAHLRSWQWATWPLILFPRSFPHSSLWHIGLWLWHCYHCLCSSSELPPGDSVSLYIRKIGSSPHAFDHYSLLRYVSRLDFFPWSKNIPHLPVFLCGNVSLILTQYLTDFSVRKGTVNGQNSTQEIYKDLYCGSPLNPLPNNFREQTSNPVNNPPQLFQPTKVQYLPVSLCLCVCLC